MSTFPHLTLLLCACITQNAQTEVSVPMRALTAGPNAHWFGYYDKHEFDPTGRYVLGMEVGFQGRTPEPDDTITLGMIDLQDGDRWIEIGESRAWCWQQGCMLQWLPGSKSEVIYNDRQGDAYVAVIRDVFTGESRTIPRPVYCVSPDGKTGMSVPFARIDDTRPGYGYKGVIDPYADQLHPADDGIYRVDLVTGESARIITFDQIAAVPVDNAPQGKHWFNHLLFNQDGSRFIFLHRAFIDPVVRTSRSTRMFTANPDGTSVYCLADHGMVSHFIWRNPKEILAWSREPERNAFHLYEDQTDSVTPVGEDVLKVDGHCTYSPDGKWILTDTYPNADRLITLMLFRPEDSKLLIVGKFFHGKEHSGEFRCDLHPRWSRDGKYVCIDSIHTGQRQIYLLDMSEILASN